MNNNKYHFRNILFLKRYCLYSYLMIWLLTSSICHLLPYWWQWKMCRMLKIKKTEIVCITIWSFYGHYREYKLAIHIFKYYTKTIKGDTMTGSFVLCLSIYICSTWIVGFIFQTWYKMKSMTGLHIFVQIKSFYDFGHIGRDIVTKVHHIYIPNDSSRLTLLASICISWILKILFWQYHFNLNIKSWIWQNATPSILHNIIYTRQVYTAYHFA